tara:strand:- start:1334 stop:1900 length:567 start_codon:yes stop_codon:yes gene_type:complete
MKKILFTLTLLICFSSFGQAELDYEEKLKALVETAYEKYLAGDYISAAADYKKITEQYDPKFESSYQFYISYAWFYSGLIKLDIDAECSNAIIDFNKSIKLNPSFTPAYNSRATAHICMGNFQEAIDDCEALIKSESNDDLIRSAYEQMILAKSRLNLDYCSDYKTIKELKLKLSSSIFEIVDFNNCN